MKPSLPVVNEDSRTEQVPSYRKLDGNQNTLPLERSGFHRQGFYVMCWELSSLVTLQSRFLAAASTHPTLT